MGRDMVPLLRSQDADKAQKQGRKGKAACISEGAWQEMMYICPHCKDWYVTRRGLNTHIGIKHKTENYIINDPGESTE